MAIQLGDVALDRITGLSGVVVIDSRYLHGGRRLTLQPRVLHDGRPVESITYDEGLLELVVTAAEATGTP